MGVQFNLDIPLFFPFFRSPLGSAPPLNLRLPSLSGAQYMNSFSPRYLSYGSIMFDISLPALQTTLPSPCTCDSGVEGDVVLYRMPYQHGFVYTLECIASFWIAKMHPVEVVVNAHKESIRSKNGDLRVKEC